MQEEDGHEEKEAQHHSERGEVVGEGLQQVTRVLVVSEGSNGDLAREEFNKHRYLLCDVEVGVAWFEVVDLELEDAVLVWELEVLFVGLSVLVILLQLQAVVGVEHLELHEDVVGVVGLPHALDVVPLVEVDGEVDLLADAVVDGLQVLRVHSPVHQVVGLQDPALPEVPADQRVTELAVPEGLLAQGVVAKEVVATRDQDTRIVTPLSCGYVEHVLPEHHVLVVQVGVGRLRGADHAEHLVGLVGSEGQPRALVEDGLVHAARYDSLPDEVVGGHELLVVLEVVVDLRALKIILYIPPPSLPARACRSRTRSSCTGSTWTGPRCPRSARSAPSRRSSSPPSPSGP